MDDELRLVLALGTQARAEREGMSPDSQQLARDVLGGLVDRYHATTTAPDDASAAE